MKLMASNMANLVEGGDSHGDERQKTEAYRTEIA